jgi:hypothetical protein
MPVHVPRAVRCPTCKEEFVAKLVGTLHATRRPEVRDAVLDGSFGRVACTRCGTDVRTEPVLLYTDFPRRQYYAHLPHVGFAWRDDLEAKIREGFRINFEVSAAPMVKEWAPEFRVRVVFGPERLRDKLVCDDLGLDDRLVELGKIGLLRDAGPSSFAWDVGLYLRGQTAGGFVFQLVTSPDPGTEIVREFLVGNDWYANVKAREEGLREQLPEFFSTAIVDYRMLFAPPSIPLPPARKPPPGVEDLYEIL